MHCVYVGKVDPQFPMEELYDVFSACGGVKTMLDTPGPPCHALVYYDEYSDALKAIRELNGKNGWKVEFFDVTKEPRTPCDVFDPSAWEVCKPDVGPHGLGSRSPEMYTPMKKDNDIEPTEVEESVAEVVLGFFKRYASRLKIQKKNDVEVQ